MNKITLVGIAALIEQGQRITVITTSSTHSLELAAALDLEIRSDTAKGKRAGGEVTLYDVRTGGEARFLSYRQEHSLRGRTADTVYITREAAPHCTTNLLRTAHTIVATSTTSQIITE